MKVEDQLFLNNVKFFQKAILMHPTEEKFLALKKSPNDSDRPNHWDLPGGNVAFGETHLGSLLREIKEEANLEVADLKPVFVNSTFNEDKIYRLFIGYKGRALGTNVNLSDEHTEYKWMTKEEFLNLESAYYLMDFVKEAF